MKKILICFILIFSLALCSCDSLFKNENTADNTDGSTDTDTSNGKNSSSNDGSQNGSSDGSDTDNCRGPALQHTDVDDNGICDGCDTDVTVEINFFVLNDFHGKMSDSDTQPGADELSLYLKDAVKNNPNTILISTGDMWQGGAESNLTKGLMVTDWMNELDFVSMTLGNHEYDWGEEYIIKNAEAAEFPLLAINIYDRDTDKLAEYCTPSVMVERGGIQIGIIGAIGDCYSSISGDKCEDVYFKVGYELSYLVKEESKRLRENGADLIVYSLHDGYGSSRGSGSISNNALSSYYDYSLSSGNYVDIVFEGHTHQSYALVDSYGVYHLQGGGDNSGISHAELLVNFANGNVGTTKTALISSSTYAYLDDDPYIDELYQKYAEQIAKAYEVLGYNGGFIAGNDLKQLIAELYYELGEEVWAEEYDIVLGGGYISVRSPYNLYEGEVTYADLMMLFPFDNELVLCSISGYNLRTKFFETNNSNYYISYGAYGEDVRNNIDDNATYYIITDTYSSQYKPNKLTVIAKYDSTTFARDLLAEYIKAGKLW